MTNSIRPRGILGFASLLVLMAARDRTVTPAETSVTKPGCIGCSVDGKTAPRTSDGHPDLNGYWSGAAPNPNAATASNANAGSSGNPAGGTAAPAAPG